MATVSVVIPTYNSEAYIAETLTSVLDQTFKDVEIIVVDDGSSDRTIPIVESFGPGLRFIAQANRGVCSARNRGISEASGRYVCFLDHDDYWYPDKLARQLEAFDRQPELGVVYSAYVLWHAEPADGRHPDPRTIDLSPFGDGLDPDFSGWIYHQFLLDCWMLTSTAMFRREVFSTCGVFDESLPFSEDWELWLRISRHFPFAMLRRPTTLYRQHDRQGNRLIREVDYRTALLSATAKRWGYRSRDGRGITPWQFRRQLAVYHASFALGHLKAHHLGIALQSFLKAWQAYPLNIRYPAYAALALLGWKPSW